MQSTLPFLGKECRISLLGPHGRAWALPTRALFTGMRKGQEDLEWKR